MLFKLTVVIAHDKERAHYSLNQLLAQIHTDSDLTELGYEVLVETRGNKSESRNLAVEKSRGEILVFLDDDVQLRRHFFEEILEPFSDPKVGIVGGVNVNFDGIPLSQKISATFYASPFFMAKSVSRYTPRGLPRETDESEIIGCCMAVRKKAFVEAGGFPVDVIPCEENVLINRIQRAGWKVLYNPFAIVFHARPEFPWEYADKIFHYGMGRGKMMRDLKKMGSPRMFWKPSWKWLIYVLGFLIHYICYISGVIYGYLKGGKKK